jgi:hypothetical protein
MSSTCLRRCDPPHSDMPRDVAPDNLLTQKTRTVAKDEEPAT